jgi:hypothetical protein
LGSRNPPSSDPGYFGLSSAFAATKVKVSKQATHEPSKRFDIRSLRHSNDFDDQHSRDSPSGWRPLLTCHHVSQWDRALKIDFFRGIDIGESYLPRSQSAATVPRICVFFIESISRTNF